jgi:Tetracyclin repressor-like, C-terminal domain
MPRRGQRTTGLFRPSPTARAGFERRAEQLAGVLARSFAERPVLCDRISAQAAVLEHNVSTDTIASFKRRGVASAARCC